MKTFFLFSYQTYIFEYVKFVLSSFFDSFFVKRGIEIFFAVFSEKADIYFFEKEESPLLSSHLQYSIYPFALSMYSPVLVSILILSPITTNNGTCKVYPVEIVAGFVALPIVSPFNPGSV